MFPCFTITSTLFQHSIRPHTLPQLVYAPLLFCQSKGQGYTGSACQSKAGSAEEAASNGHAKIHVHKETSSQSFRRGFKTQLRDTGCWGNTNNVCACCLVQQSSLFPCSTHPNKEQNSKGQPRFSFYFQDYVKLLHHTSHSDWQQIIIYKFCTAAKVNLNGA